MPQLSDLIEKKKFVKKEYRPWDLSGTGTVDGKEKVTVKSEEIALVAKSSPETVKIETLAPSITIPSLPVKEIPELAKIDTINPITSKNTDNKSGNVLDNKQVTTGEQPDNLQVTQDKQRDNKPVTIREQPGNITDNVAGNTEGLVYFIETIKKLSGIQKNIFCYILNVCSARGVLDTGNVLSSDLANASNCSIGSAKTSLIRLVEKHLVIRLKGKASRGGHMVLGITKEIQAASIQAQHALFNPLKMMQTDNIIGNTTSNTTSYSSSINKNNTTTALPQEWKKINFELLAHIGFSETQLRQLHDSNITAPEIIQDAINRFAYSLEHSDKVKAYHDPLNVLMGVLRKGQKWNEPNYISPKELALRQLLEEKRKKKEQFDAMVKELIELEFPDWLKKLSDQEIKQIVPADILKMNVSAATQSALRKYFVENILFPRLELEN